MLSVSSARYLVLVNNDFVGHIIPGRGLRQGDPLSPCLFIICAKGLSSLIRQVEAHGDLHGIKICRGAPILSHLSFAEGSLFFFRANQKEALIMNNIQSNYERVSSQVINL